MYMHISCQNVFITLNIIIMPKYMHIGVCFNYFLLWLQISLIVDNLNWAGYDMTQVIKSIM